ncbi:hypothetical protein [Micromonospora echinofusca]|uniref:hypothetical protein n=1 Tax=Micromonospora echinofusca TaxID=47858 RepID=UPI0012FE1101|nr:hypothetical protein [Micromonospora echinofusca]
MARQKRNSGRHSSNGDAKTDVMVRDDVTAEPFVFPYSDFFRHTRMGTESELAGDRPSPRVVATGRPGHAAVS